jgi:hypothetical protein
MEGVRWLDLVLIYIFVPPNYWTLVIRHIL